jgi:hypothetical protein
MRVLLVVCLLLVVVGCGGNSTSSTSAVSHGKSCRSVATESDYVAVKGGRLGQGNGACL